MEQGVPFPLVRLFARLAEPADRAEAQREAAARLQVESLLIFVWDTEVGMFLIAPGFSRTLPEGQAWQRFLGGCQDGKWLPGSLPVYTPGQPVAVTGLGWKKQSALVLVGGNPRELEEVAALFPSLAIALQTEYSLALHAAREGLAYEVARRANILAQELDHARRAAQGEITGRKQAEKELRLVGEQLQRTNGELIAARDKAVAAAGAKDDFLAALSHELRTPLNPVLLVASEAMTNPNLPAAVRADFEMIAKNVSLEARLIDDLLDLTRISRGKMLFEKELVGVNRVLGDTITMLGAELSEKCIEISQAFSPEQPQVLGDAVRLHQIFWNVVKNAVKFTPPGGTIRVASAILPGRETVRVEVSDSGIGLTEDECGRIFEAFSQGEHAAGRGAHRYGGLGLGLAISRALVELHGGTIKARSGGRDQGSTFTIELPNHQKSETGGPGPSAATAGEGETGAPTNSEAHGLTPPSLRILLVEDHGPSRETQARILSRRGHHVQSTGTARGALALAEREDFDLVISDLGLPDRHGFELMAELRLIRPEMVGIALSGYGMEHDQAQGRAAGFRAHLIKPVNALELDAAIAAALLHPGGLETKGSERG